MPCPCSSTSLVYISTEPVLKLKRPTNAVCAKRYVVSTNVAKVISTVPATRCTRKVVAVQQVATPVDTPVAVAEPAVAISEPAVAVAEPTVAVENVQRVEAIESEKTVVVPNTPIVRQTVTYEKACPCKTPTTFVKNVETVVNRHHYHTVKVVDNTNNYNTYVTNHITKVNDIHHQRVENVQGETRVIEDSKENTIVEPAKCFKVVDGKTVAC